MIASTIVRKNRNLSGVNKIHLNSNVIDGSVLNGISQPILHSFILDKPPVYQLLCNPETIHYIKNK